MTYRECEKPKVFKEMKMNKDFHRSPLPPPQKHFIYLVERQISYDWKNMQIFYLYCIDFRNDAETNPVFKDKKYVYY